MKHSYLLAGIKPGRLVALLKRNKGFSAKYANRIGFLFSIGVWADFFERKEKRHFGKELKEIKELESPIFIVGHWRTGTTFLHQLLALDPQTNFMDVFKVSHPNHFLVSRKYYTRVMSKFLDGPRPMDNVKLGMAEPQEDEYALIKLLDDLPLEALIFQKKDAFFLDTEDDFMPADRQKFFETLDLLVRKLMVEKKGCRVLFKNPFHSLRAGALRSHFPGARFVHIIRDPKKVVPSSIHMWNVVGKQNILKGKWISPKINVIADFYSHILTSLRKEFANSSPDEYVEIYFEELEKDPINVVRNLYKSWRLDFTEEYEQKLRAFVDEIKDYKKNTYNISQEDERLIRERFSALLPQYFNN